MRFVKNIYMLVLFLFVLTFGCKNNLETESNLFTLANQNMVTIAEIPSFQYVCIPFKGGYENHQLVVDKIESAIKEQKIETKGPIFSIYYNRPENTCKEDLIWEIGYQVPDHIEVSTPLELKLWNSSKIIQATHIGAYKNIGEMYFKIFDSIRELNLTETGTAMERFLDKNSPQIKPENLMTQIWVPIINIVTEQ